MFRRRRLLLATVAVLSSRAVPSIASSQKIVARSADTLSEEERQTHEHYMQMSIDEIDGGPPFGAVIVDHGSGKVMCKGWNRGNANRIYHDEMDAMINCGDEHPQLDWRRLTL